MGVQDMELVNYNTNGKILDMEFLMKTPLYVVRHKFGDSVLYFMECSRAEAKKMIEDNHYSHKFTSSFGKVNIGVYKEGRLIGVASYGNPIDYHVDTTELIELNRMWLSDELGRNAESILISVSIKMLRRLLPDLKFVQSFSDGRLGCGIVYQSANFKYFGYKESVFAFDTDGTQYHRMTIEKIEDIDDFLDRMKHIVSGDYTVRAIKTHKYIFELDKKVKYDKKEEPYPKESGGYTDVKYHKALKVAYIRAYLLNKALGYNYEPYRQVLLDNIENLDEVAKNYKGYILKAIREQKPNEYDMASERLGMTKPEITVPSLLDSMEF